MQGRMLSLSLPLLSAALWSCGGDPMSSDHARTTASISQGSTGELNGGPSFKLDIGIGGKIVPHASIRVRGVVSALRTTPLVHVDLMVFEAQAPQQSGWKQNLGVPVFAKPMSEA